MQKELLATAMIIAGFTLSAQAVAKTDASVSIGGVAIPTSPNPNQVMNADTYKGTSEQLSNQASQKLTQTVKDQIQASGGKTTDTSAPATSAAPKTPAAQPSSTNTQPAGNNAKPSSNDVYTGFGSGQSDNQDSNSDKNNSEKSSNWNVGY